MKGLYTNVAVAARAVEPFDESEPLGVLATAGRGASSGVFACGTGGCSLVERGCGTSFRRALVSIASF